MDSGARHDVYSESMIVLHGTWSTPTFYVWGEETSRKDALSTAELHAAAGDLSPDGLLASIAGETTVDLWLPCDDRGVLRCDQCAAPADSGEIRLEAVTVPALAFSPADASDLLAGLSPEGPAPAGPSLRYWAALADYTLSLVAREQFVPHVEEIDEQSFTGKWYVVVTDHRELAWLERLVAAMPPVCRAIVTDDRAITLPARLVDDFLAHTAEAVIRRSLDADPFFRQIHDRALKADDWQLNWLSSLLGDPRRVGWAGEDGRATASQVRSWSGQLHRKDGDGLPELSFTLIAPEDDDGTWHVGFDLRAADTGELLDVSQIWHDDDDAPSILGRHLVSRREHLRGELTRASQVFDAIGRTLAHPASPGVDLDPHEAHAFIRQGTPLLRGQGFSVALPDWAERDDRRFGLKMLVRPRGELPGPGGALGMPSGVFGLGGVLEFDWRVALGDRQLSIEEFDALVSRNLPLVKVGGQWVDVDRQDAETAMDFVRKQPRGELTLAQAIRMAAGAEEAETGLPVVALSGDSWLGPLLDEAREATIDRLEQPPGFQGTLRPYQLRGLEWMAFLDRLGIGACLADDMGLGKTIEMIALLLHERRGGQTVGPTLLFVPMSLVGNWHREIQRFSPSLRALVHHGPDRLSGDAFVDEAAQSDVVITTYGLANRDRDVLSRVQWHRLTLDEAQKIKNPSAGQTIAVRSLQAPHRIGLTGTPLENHLSELWSIMEMLNPGLLGSAADFRKRFAVPIEKMGDQKRAEQLRRTIQPFLLRRLKSDPAVECDLPEKMEMRVYCNLTPEQAALYEQTVREMLEEIDDASGIRRRGLVLAALTRLKQTCNHPVHLLQDGGPLDDRSGKCERLVEMLEEVLEEGDAALVFTQYRVMGDLLGQLISDRLQTNAPFLHGGTTAKQRDEMVRNFQEPDGGPPVMLLSLKAGGLGLNLTRANHVFHFDRWWNPAVEDQATDRVHRIGQTRRVLVHKFVCIGTIEDRIDKMLTDKSALADRIVGSGDGWLTELSTSDLRRYLSLSPEAVAES